MMKTVDLKSAPPTDKRRYNQTLDGLPFYNRGVLIAGIIPKGSKVLDIGCGPGQLDEYLIKHKGCKVTGIDWSDESLAVAKRRGVETITFDLNLGLPKVDGPFDIILANEVLEHLVYPQNLLKQIKPILGNGELIVSLPQGTYWRNRVELLFGKVSKFITGDPTKDGSEPFHHHFHVFDIKLMRQLLSDYTILQEMGVGRIGMLEPTLGMQVIIRACNKR